MGGDDPTEPVAAPTGNGKGGASRLADSSTLEVPVRRRRPWGWIAATAVVSAAALIAGGYGAVTYQSARSWEDRASSWEERAVSLEGQRDEIAAERDDLTEELAATETELADTETELADAEAELADTETDLAETESELGETEDQLAGVTADREAARDKAARLADDVDIAAVVGADLSVCVDDLFAWLGDQPSYRASQAAWDIYFERGLEIADVCGQAQNNFASFLQALQN